MVRNLADGEIAAWPDNLSGFKSLVVDMGWLKERNTDRNVCLFGYYEGEIAAGTTAVNVVLGRLVCRLNIAVSAKTAGIFSNVKREPTPVNAPGSKSKQRKEGPNIQKPLTWAEVTSMIIPSAETITIHSTSF